jgi:hypothetical protein
MPALVVDLLEVVFSAAILLPFRTEQERRRRDVSDFAAERSFEAAL